MTSKILLERNLNNIKDRIKFSALKVGRAPESIKLVAVTKNRSIEEIISLYELGVRDFGENRVEQALQKINALVSLPDVRWHMIGKVQSRKAKDVSINFDYIHSIDSLKLATKLDRYSNVDKRILPSLVQINISGEESKSGWWAADEKQWDKLIPDFETLFKFKNLKINGLMTMAPYDVEPEKARIYFRKLSELKNYLHLSLPDKGFNELSMGMSGDFEVAIEEGATMARIGSSIFSD